MNFDPNPMPESNVFSEVVKGDAWLCMTAQEKAKRLAEEKLDRYRRAVAILKLTFENQGYIDAAKATQEKIDEIERVGT